MEPVFFTPGPSQLYPTIPDHITHALEESVPSISHRSQAFKDIFQKTVASLKKLLLIPEDYSVFFVSSGTEAMERCIENCVEKKSYHFYNGSFSKRFYQTAIELQRSSVGYEAPAGEAFDLEKVTIEPDTEMICMTHNETATGVMLPLEFMYTMQRNHPHMLVAVDIVSSVPYVDLDYAKIDNSFFSVQKGFGMPSGLGVVILSPRALEKTEKMQKNGTLVVPSYKSFVDMKQYADKFQTKETPNVLGIYLLGKVAEDMIKYGVKRIRKQTDQKAQLIYDALSSDARYTLSVADPSVRSKTVIVAQVAGGSKSLIQKAREQGLIIAAGYGSLKETHIRIANFPAHTLDQTKQLVTFLSQQ